MEQKEFYSIGEVSEITGLPPYTLRYWETEFNILKPLRRSSRHRKYTIKDIERIKKIQGLLHKKKFTIEGAKKALRNIEKEQAQQLHLDFGKNSAAVEMIKEIKRDINEIRERLKD